MTPNALPPDDRELARFGAMLAAIFALPAAWRLLNAGWLAPLAALAAAALVAFLAATQPSRLARIHHLLTRLGTWLGRVNTTLLLTLAFFLLVLPIGLALRLAGRDPLDRRLRDRDSYWHRREPAGDPRGSMEHQF